MLIERQLLFLVDLLVQLGDCVDPGADFTGTLGFTDVYRSPAFGAHDFIRVEKASVGLLEDLTALRSRALKRVRQLVEIAGHERPPIRASEASSIAQSRQAETR